MTFSFVEHARYQTVTLALILASCAYIFIFSLLHPYDVWDMLGYAAAVQSLNGADISEIHATVFADFKTHTTAATYQELTTSTPYRMTMSTSPDAFSQQIPFYKIRLLYVLLLVAMTHMGFEVFESMHIVSAGFASAGLLLIYLGLRNQVHSLLWLLIPIVFVGVTTDLRIVQQGGVDTFAFFWMSLTIVCYVRGSKLLLPMLALCVLVRTDFIIHAALMFAVLLFSDKSNRKLIVIWGIATLLTYFALNEWAGNYGWFSLIHFVFVSDMSATHPADYSQYSSFNLQDYLGFVLTMDSWISKWLWLCIGCSLVSFSGYLWYCKTPSTQSLAHAFQATQRLNIACFICLAYVAIHYILFPAIFMRFFIGSCLFMVVSMLGTASYLYRVKYVDTKHRNYSQADCITRPTLNGSR